MSIELGYGTGVDKGNRAVVSTSIDIFDNEGNKIGFCTNISRSDTRTINKIRHIDSADAGRVVELQPGPADYSLTINGFALYNDGNKRGGLLNRIPGTASAQYAALDQQQAMFNLRVLEKHPVSGEESATYYYNCMISNYSKPTAIGSVNIAESVTVVVSYVDYK